MNWRTLLKQGSNKTHTLVFGVSLTRESLLSSSLDEICDHKFPYCQNAFQNRQMIKKDSSNLKPAKLWFQSILTLNGEDFCFLLRFPLLDPWIPSASGIGPTLLPEAFPVLDVLEAEIPAPTTEWFPFILDLSMTSRFSSLTFAEGSNIEKQNDHVHHHSNGWGRKGRGEELIMIVAKQRIYFKPTKFDFI